MEVENQRYTELRRENVNVLLRKYSVPSIISMLAVALYNIVDRIYIGQGIDDPMAFSGLTLTLPVSSIVAAIGTLVGVGASSRISIVLGMKDIKWARNILGHVPILSLIMSAIFIVPTMIFLEPILMVFGADADTMSYAKEYLSIVVPASLFTNLCFSLSSVMRASGFPKKSMSVILLGVVMNIILDPIFIFVFDLGIRGAAIATAISMLAGAVYAISHFMNKRLEVSFRRDCFVLKGRIIKNIVSIGFSPFVMNVIASGVVILINTSLLRHGGGLAISSYGIINTYQILLGNTVMGICQGMQPIVGFNYGARNYKRVKDTFLAAVKAGVIVFSAGFLFVELFPRFASSLITSDSQVIEKTAHGIRIVFVVAFLVGAQIVVSNYFMAVGKALRSTIMTLSRQVIFLIPMLLFLPRFLGMDGVWWAIAISDVMAFLLASAFILREKKILYPPRKKQSH